MSTVGLWACAIAAFFVPVSAAAAEPESVASEDAADSPAGERPVAAADEAATEVELPAGSRELAEIERLLTAGESDVAAEQCSEALAAPGIGLATFRALHIRCVEALATAKAPAEEVAAVARIALALAPDSEARAEAPRRVKKAFKAARAHWAESIPFSVRHTVPAPVAVGADLALAVEVESDPLALVDHWILVYRPVGAVELTRMNARPAEGEDGVTFVIRNEVAVSGRDGRVEYHLQAVTGTGSVVAEIGSAGAPRMASVALPPPVEEPSVAATEAVDPEPARREGKSRSRSIARAWWLWVAVGAVVAAGAATGTYLAVTRASGATLLFTYEVTTP